MPKVSVIIPNYNHAAFLRKRIESVLNQTYQDFELILLDDDSNDDSKIVIESYRNHPKVSKIIYNQQNSGTTFKQWEKGLKNAVGELVWIAESDDYAAPEFLETLIASFFTEPDLILSFCRSMQIDENDTELGPVLHADQLDPVRWQKSYLTDGKVEIEKYLQYRNTIPNASAVLFRRPINLDKSLRTDLKYCGDWFFWKELLSQKNALIAYTPKMLNYFRTHSQTTRDLSLRSTLSTEIKRFREYRFFVPNLYYNVLSDKFRWMMAEWIDRGVPELAANTRYGFFPLLHPALAIRYYLHAVKKIIIRVKEKFIL